MCGDWTSGLGNLTRRGTRLRRFWSVDSASTKSRSFWEGKGWRLEVWRTLKLGASAFCTCKHLERPWAVALSNSQRLLSQPASRSLLPPAKLHRPVSLSPRVSTRVIPVACLRHSQRQFSASLLTSCLPCLLPLFSRPRSTEDYVEQQPTSDARMPENFPM